jgi:ZIP family zinc transporter
MIDVLIWSLVAALGTAAGSFAVYLVRTPGTRLLDGAAGFAAGVMISATVFGLIPAASNEMREVGVAAWIIVGFVAIALMDRFLPHAHARHEDTSGYPGATRKAKLLALALTLHNIPEGMAVGTAFAAGGTHLGIPLAIAIAAHNIPEGFAVSAPAVSSGVARAKTARLGALTGLVEIPSMIVAYMLARSVEAAIAPMLALAAGAMLYVVFDELLPDTARHSDERFVAGWVLAGIIVLYLLQSFVVSLV